MSAVDECGEYPAVQPTDEMDVRVISLDAERIRRRMEVSTVPSFRDLDADALERLFTDLVERRVREAIEKSRE